MQTTTEASAFTRDEWAAWDAFLASSREPSIHLSSAAVRASLRSPKRAVRAAVWVHLHVRPIGPTDARVGFSSAREGPTAVARHRERL